MNVKAEIKKMEQRMFTQEFLVYLNNCYKERSLEQYFRILHEEYDAAKCFFSSESNEEEKQCIEQWESIQELCVGYAGKFCYYSGVFEAFNQYFHLERPAAATFSNVTSRSVMDHQEAMLEPEYKDLVKRANDLNERLSINEEEQWTEHLTSLECYWDQRIYSASMDGFYLGYRSSLKLIGHMHYDRTEAMISNVLLTEYALGLTQPQIMRESWSKEAEHVR